MHELPMLQSHRKQSVLVTRVIITQKTDCAIYNVKVMTNVTIALKKDFASYQRSNHIQNRSRKLQRNNHTQNRLRAEPT